MKQIYFRQMSAEHMPSKTWQLMEDNVNEKWIWKMMFTKRYMYVSSPILHLHVMGDPSGSVIPLWDSYCPVAQTGLESCFWGPIPRLCPNGLTHNAAGWPECLLTYLGQVTGCWTHALSTPSSVEADEHTALCFACAPWLSWNRGLVLCSRPMKKTN